MAPTPLENLVLNAIGTLETIYLTMTAIDLEVRKRKILESRFAGLDLSTSDIKCLRPTTWYSMGDSESSVAVSKML